MTAADYLIVVGAIAAWVLLMCAGAAFAEWVLGPDPDLQGPWDPRR